MNRPIRKVAVIGSGVMGSRIACHFAGIGVQVCCWILSPGADRSRKSQRPDPGKQGGQEQDRERGTAGTLKAKPSAVYTKEVAAHITTGNIEDDLP